MHFTTIGQFDALVIQELLELNLLYKLGIFFMETFHLESIAGHFSSLIMYRLAGFTPTFVDKLSFIDHNSFS